MPEYAMNQYAEIIVFFLVGTVAGVLADQGRRHRMELEASSEKLAKANQDLQASELSPMPGVGLEQQRG